MRQVEQFAPGMEVFALVLSAQLVGTPEQRAEWQRQGDWQHYASKYTD